VRRVLKTDNKAVATAKEMNYRYFTYGYGSRYALIDGYTQRVWLMLDDVEMLKRIQRLFFSKVPLILVDISNLENYTPELIDNSVCLDWQLTGPDLGMLDEDVFSNSVSAKIFCFDRRHKFVDFTQPTPLHNDRAMDLQRQMMMFYQIVRSVRTPHLDKTVDTISKSFLVNLTVSDIENSLANLPDADKGLQLTILRASGKLYD
jgi:hypothetical protein